MDVIVEFIYPSRSFLVKGKENDLIEKYYEQFIKSIGDEKKNAKLDFIYNGKSCFYAGQDKKSTFNTIANEFDKQSKKMTIIVKESQPEKKITKTKSDQIICPECGDSSILMFLKKYAISLSKCEKGHIFKKYLSPNAFEKTQNVTDSKEICINCKDDKLVKEHMFKCLSCQQSFCIKCIKEHSKTHRKIIPYYIINSVCEKNNDFYSGFCKQCQKHFCPVCEAQHKNHKDIQYFTNDFYPKDEDIDNKEKELKEIDLKNFNESCDEIINIINIVKKNINSYYEFITRIIKAYDKKNKNYFSFCNVKEIIQKDEITKDLKYINNEKNISNKIIKMLKIYDGINYISINEQEEKMDVFKENEILKNKINILNNTLKQKEKELEQFNEIKNQYDLIKYVIYAGLDKDTKECKYNKAYKCLLVELILPDIESKTTFIQSEKVANVMLEIDRGDFVPNNNEEYHYINKPISLGYNTTISAPHMHSFALEYLESFCTEGAKILDIGSGSGYLTVALSKMINHTGLVVGVEHIPDLYKKGLENVKKKHKNLIDEKKIIFVNEDGRKGCTNYAPYKVIHVGAACEQLPEEIIKQLDCNGRMFIPIGKEEDVQKINIIDKDKDGNITTQEVLDVCYGMLRDKESQMKLE